jgi:hypothetical protein
MSDDSKINEINVLKLRVNELVKTIQNLKNLLARSEIPLKDFRLKKASLEEELRGALRKIAYYKEEISAEPPKKEIDTIAEFVPIEEAIKHPKVEPEVRVLERVKSIEARPHVKEQLEEMGISTEDSAIEKATQMINTEAQIAEEANALMLHYHADFTESITKASVSLSITPEHHFTIEIDFTDYPNRPKVTIPSTVVKKFTESGSNVFENIPTLFKWNPNAPARIFQIIAELKAELMRAYGVEKEKRKEVSPEIAPLPEEVVTREIEVFSNLTFAWYMLVIVAMVGVLIMGMMSVDPLIPIISFGVMVVLTYFNGNLEIDFSNGTKNSEMESKSE